MSNSIQKKFYKEHQPIVQKLKQSEILSNSVQTEPHFANIWIACQHVRQKERTKAVTVTVLNTSEDIS